MRSHYLIADPATALSYRILREFASYFSNITAQVIRIKLDKEFKGAKGPSTVFNILVEDKTGTTNICSFGDDAVRLKALVADQTV